MTADELQKWDDEAVVATMADGTERIGIFEAMAGGRYQFVPLIPQAGLSRYTTGLFDSFNADEITAIKHAPAALIPRSWA